VDFGELSSVKGFAAVYKKAHGDKKILYLINNAGTAGAAAVCNCCYVRVVHTLAPESILSEM